MQRIFFVLIVLFLSLATNKVLANLDSEKFSYSEAQELANSMKFLEPLLKMSKQGLTLEQERALAIMQDPEILLHISQLLTKAYSMPEMTLEQCQKFLNSKEAIAQFQEYENMVNNIDSATASIEEIKAALKKFDVNENILCQIMYANKTEKTDTVIVQ
jgi:hypothetical protein